MASPDPMQDWFSEFLELHGAETEVGENAIEAILPPRLFERAGWEEFERFVFDPGLNGRLVSYHSDILEVVKPLIEERGGFVNIGIPAQVVKREGFEASVADEVAFVNGVFRLQQAEESTDSYCIVHFKATAVSEEKRETLVAVALNTRTGSPVDQIVPLVEQRLDVAPETREAAAERPDFARWADRLGALARRKAVAAFTDFGKSLSRRLSRDVQRLEEYYTALERELRKKIERTNPSGEDAARSQGKIEAIQRELQKKIRDQRARYEMTVRLEPLAVLAASHPVMRLRLTLLRRKQSREMVWTYNPLCKQVERPGCESCFESIRQLHLCDERVHLLCPGCAVHLPRNCPVCSRK